MNQTEIPPRVQKAICDTLKVPADQIQPSSRLVEDLDVDSLFITQLALALEDEFDITVSDEEMPGLTTVQAVADYVAQKLGDK